MATTVRKGYGVLLQSGLLDFKVWGSPYAFQDLFLLYVDRNGLRNAKCGMDAVESGIKPCDLGKEAPNQHPLTPLSLTKAIIVGYLGIFSIYWVLFFYSI